MGDRLEFGEIFSGKLEQFSPPRKVNGRLVGNIGKCDGDVVVGEDIGESSDGEGDEAGDISVSLIIIFFGLEAVVDVRSERERSNGASDIMESIVFL